MHYKCIIIGANRLKAMGFLAKTIKTNYTESDIVELTRDEIVERIEKGAQRRACSSAYELLRQYRAGKLQDPGSVADLLALSNLLPDDDPVFGNNATA